jgi:hypothetical protein
VRFPWNPTSVVVLNPVKEVQQELSLCKVEEVEEDEVKKREEDEEGEIWVNVVEEEEMLEWCLFTSSC